MGHWAYPAPKLTSKNHVLNLLGTNYSLMHSDSIMEILFSIKTRVTTTSNTLCGVKLTIAEWVAIDIQKYFHPL